MQSISEKFKCGKFQIKQSVFKFLKEEQEDNLIMACSGGADSVFATLALYGLKDNLGLNIIMVHFNHRWRPKESELDRAFVEELSDNLGLKFFSKSSDIDYSDKIKSETLAREQRINYLREIAASENANIIAFGHQMDDIIETQIIRLARGSGIDGLVAPRPIHKFSKYPTHVRPILNFESNQIKKILSDHSVYWREDKSNLDQSIIRNNIRHSIIPRLKESMKRNIAEGASKSRQLLEEDSLCLDNIARDRFPDCYTLVSKINREQFLNEDRAIIRRAIFYWLHKLNPGFVASSTLQENILNALVGSDNGIKFSVGEKFIRMNKRLVWLEKG